MLTLREAHFSSLPAQSNIYGFSTLATKKTASKVLITSLKRKVFCVEYCKNLNFWIPSTREVQFTYIPSTAEIISIDSFNRSSNDHDFIVAITFIKNAESDSGQKYLNIYSDWEPGGECVLDNIAQGCLMIELDFVPYHLTHAPRWTPDIKEVVWLLSGSNNKIHVYHEDPVSQCFTEQPISEFFPEFDNLPSIAYWMQVKQMDTKRISAVGCENGVVRAAIVETSKSEPIILRSFEVQHDSPISVVQIFTDRNVIPKPSFLKDLSGVPTEPVDNVIHLLIGSMLGKAVVYRNILENDFKESKLLQNSDKFDCITTACVADIDFDGKNEILLGTYGQQLLIYKWNCNESYYSVMWQRSFSHPLHALTYMDLMGDGVKELLVLSTNGLHILQYNPEEVARLCLKRLALLETLTKT